MMKKDAAGQPYIELLDVVSYADGLTLALAKVAAVITVGFIVFMQF